MPEPSPPIVNDGRTTTGRPSSATVSRTSSIVKQTARLRGFAADLGDDVLEPLPILAALDGVEVGADHLDAVALERAILVQRDGGVQRGLPAERRQHGVDLVAALGLLGDDLLDERRR